MAEESLPNSLLIPHGVCEVSLNKDVPFCVAEEGGREGQ